jgi:transposase
MMIDGYTNSEAAEVLNVSKNTITNMKGRIRKKYILQEA